MSQDFVQFYTIRIVDRNVNATQPGDTIIAGTVNRVTVPGLMPGHTYDVYVIANSSYVWATSASREETLSKRNAITERSEFQWSKLCNTNLKQVLLQMLFAI